MIFPLLVFLSGSCAIIKSEEEFKFKTTNRWIFTVSRVKHHYLRPKWEWEQLKIFEKDLLEKVRKTWLWMRGSGNFLGKMKNEQSNNKQVNCTKVFSFSFIALSTFCSCISNILVNIIISSFEMWSVFENSYQPLLHLWWPDIHI